MDLEKIGREHESVILYIIHQMYFLVLIVYRQTTAGLFDSDVITKTNLNAK